MNTTTESNHPALVSQPDGAFYPVFPGITIQLSDLHLARCPERRPPEAGTFSIDFCLSGHMEWEGKGEIFCSVSQGDIRLSLHSGWKGTYEFPTCSYQGLTVTIQPQSAQGSLNQLQPWLSIQADVLPQQDLRNRDLIFSADPELDRLFHTLATLCRQQDFTGIRLKVLELLLLLPHRIDQLESQGARPYFPKSVVEKVRTIKELLCRELNCKKSLAQLAREYQLSETMLKRCFHMMYGNSVYAFVKNHRLHMAAKALAETDRPIMEIALEVGYENPSKFSSAFRKSYGKSPREYRNALHAAQQEESSAN